MEDDKDKKKKTYAQEKCPKCGKPIEECECDDDDDDDDKGCKKTTYSLDDIIEYVELSQKYSDLEATNADLLRQIDSLKTELSSLTAFKKNIEKKDKEAMIAKFFMLSDEDKKDVIENIDTYSLDDIEAKLSVICVRNKVRFDLDDEQENNGPTTYNLNSGDYEDAATPAWVKAVRAVAKNMNN